MKRSIKLKHAFFVFSVKTPFAALTIIILTIGTLLTIAYYSYTDVYIKEDARVHYSSATSSNGMFFEVSVNEKYLGEIKEGSKVIWYSDQDKKRYNACVFQMVKPNESIAGMVDLKIKPTDQDILSEYGNESPKPDSKVYAEVLQKRERVIYQLLNKKAGNSGEK